MPSPPASLRPRAPVTVLVLGALSALALLAASLADFGDPRVAARARAEESVRAKEVEIRYAWEGARLAGNAPAGAGTLYRFGPESRLVLAAAPRPAEGQPSEPLAGIYLELGHDALRRGAAGDAWEALSAGLARCSEGTPGYVEALYGALRAATSLGRPGDVTELRQRLFAAPTDAAVRNTSVKLLATLMAPADAEGAHRLLTDRAAYLPAPKDTARVEGQEFHFDLDPWWTLLQQRFSELAPTLNWSSAFQHETRIEDALRRFTGEQALRQSNRWTVAAAASGYVAYRWRGDDIELAALDPAAFAAAFCGNEASPGLEVRVGVDLDGLPLARDLDGSPFRWAVTHLAPEASARAEVLRLRWLRGGLLGLAALVLLAACLGARAMARARRLAELRSTFVASVSHDLRTPTQAILLLAETLEQDLIAGADNHKRYHRQIRREAQRLRRLVEDLLDGARIDRGGGARIERRVVPTEPFVADLTSALEERAASAGAELRIEQAPLPESLYIDPDGVHRAIWNLAENALHYGRTAAEGTSLTVRIQLTDEVLRVDVEDEGPGIPARYHETVFAPFQRLQDERPARGIEHDTGTGLGLAIVRALARAHDGDAVLVPSERGAHFTLTFRALEPQGEEAA